MAEIINFPGLCRRKKSETTKKLECANCGAKLKPKTATDAGVWINAANGHMERIYLCPNCCYDW